MHRPATLLILTLATLTASASDNVFEANLQIARQNLATPAGAAYDMTLSAAMQSSSKLEAALNACMIAHDGGHSLQGYLQFSRGAEFKVVLRPKDAFADCIAAALEAETVPAPPQLPWYNHFNFNVPATPEA